MQQRHRDEGEILRVLCSALLTRRVDAQRRRSAGLLPNAQDDNQKAQDDNQGTREKIICGHVG